VKYVSRTFVAMTLFAFCWVAVGYGINQMLQIGTCASGGPYVSARQCPEGTEGVILALMGGILLLFVAGGIYMIRGKPAGGAPPPSRSWVVVWFWTGLFWSLAAGCFLGVWGPDANPGPGGEAGGLIVGFMGLFMGAGGLFSLVRRRAITPSLGFSVAPALQAMALVTSRLSEPTDAGTRLETLERLRRQGMLTDAEFETLKSKIIGEA
jgi:peptidoglycan/LPS O-acetylase OafA/YrhL